MALTTSDEQKKAILARLKAGYIYVAIPFVILILVKVIHEKSFTAIILAPDWSLASCIIFGQIAANLSEAVAYNNGQVSPQSFSYYVARRFLGVVVSLVCYVFMLIDPSVALGCFQMALFLWASIRFFTDGVATSLLGKRPS